MGCIYASEIEELNLQQIPHQDFAIQPPIPIPKLISNEIKEIVSVTPETSVYYQPPSPRMFTPYLRDGYDKKYHHRSHQPFQYTAQEVVNMTIDGGRMYRSYRNQGMCFENGCEYYPRCEEDPIPDGVTKKLPNYKQVQEIHEIFDRRNLKEVKASIFRWEVNLAPEWIHMSLSDISKNGFDIQSGINHIIKHLRLGHSKEFDWFLQNPQQHDMFFALIVEHYMRTHNECISNYDTHIMFRNYNREKQLAQLRCQYRLVIESCLNIDFNIASIIVKLAYPRLF
jgi:hypothetical protein